MVCINKRQTDFSVERLGHYRRQEDKKERIAKENRPEN